MFRTGTETWTALSVYFDAGFPKIQLLVVDRRPMAAARPSQISVENEQFAIFGADSLDPRPRFQIGTIERGRWTWFSTDGVATSQSVSWRCSMDGELALPKTTSRTTDNTNPLFLNVGQYRDLANSGTAVVYIDEVRVGPTRQSMVPCDRPRSSVTSPHGVVSGPRWI